MIFSPRTLYELATMLVDANRFHHTFGDGLVTCLEAGLDFNDFFFGERAVSMVAGGDKERRAREISIWMNSRGVGHGIKSPVKMSNQEPPHHG